jgi:hypothetical protein
MLKTKQTNQPNNLALNNNINKAHKIKDPIIIIVGHNGPNIDKVINITIILNSTITILCLILILMKELQIDSSKE